MGKVKKKEAGARKGWKTVKKSAVESIWKHPTNTADEQECSVVSKTAATTFEDLACSGIPVCEECGCDLELHAVRVKESSLR